MMFTAPQRFRLSDEAAEVTRGPVVSGCTGDRQHPLGRHPALGLGDAFGDQFGHCVEIAGPLNPRWCGIAGFELVHDPFDGAWGWYRTARRPLGTTRLVD